MLGSSIGAGSGLRMSICHTPSPTAGKKQRNAAHKWARGSNLLRSTIRPFVRGQLFELIFRHDHDARSHRVMTEATEFITRHFIIARTCEAGHYIGNVTRHYHGVGVRALDEETMRHVRASQAKTNARSRWHDSTLGNEHVLLRN